MTELRRMPVLSRLGRLLACLWLISSCTLVAPPVAGAQPSTPVPAPTPAESTVVRVGVLFDTPSCRLACAEGLMFAGGNGPLGTIVSVRAIADGAEFNGNAFTGRSWRLTPCVPGHPVSVNGRDYRGDVVVALNGAGRLDIINHVDLDSYVAGVLAGEVPAAWPEETLKAQAVAARTYALQRMSRRADQAWDVVATDRDQVYEGVRGEVPALVRAVHATRGEVLSWQGQIIKAYFHSACGGHTESGAEAFGEDEPYLVGVSDPYCTQSPYQQWSREFTVAQLRRFFPPEWIQGGACLLSVQPGKRNPSGRLMEVVLVSTMGRHAIPAIDFRRLLGYRDLRSTWFDIQVKKTISVAFVSTQERVEQATVAQPGDDVEVQTEEVEPVYGVARADNPFYVIAGSGTLERNRAGYAYAATSEGVMRTFAMRPGLTVLGLAHTISVTRFKAPPKTTVTTRRVKVTKRESRPVPALLRFSGRGWGHGVGLCQWGARGMALQGHGYRDILRHYYPGARIQKVGN